MKRDLTRGSITGNLLAMSVPTMVGFSFQMIYDLIDMLWIGKISPGAIAGVTIFATVFWIIEVLNEIIGVSSISLISQNFGRKDMKATKISIEQTITFKFLVAIIAAIITLFFLEPAIRFFSNEEVVVKAALDYGYIRLFFLPMMFSSFSANTVLRCIGDAKTPMYIMAAMSVLNIVLDPILMFDKIPWLGISGFGLGVFGAAVATIISQSIAFALAMYILFSGKRGIKPTIRGLFRLHWPTDFKLLTIGLPNGMEVLIRNLSQAVILKLVASYGTLTVAAVGVAGRIFGLAFMPLIGISMGGATIVGQNLGINNVERAEKTSKTGAWLGTFFMVIFILVSALFGKQMMGVFNNDPVIVSLGASLLIWGSIGLSFIGFSFGLSTVFSGSGYTIPFVTSSFISKWLMQLPFLWLVVVVLKLEVTWIWASYLLGDLGEFIIMLLYYRKGKWKTRRVS